MPSSEQSLREAERSAVTGLQWYAICTRSRHEKVVHEGLQRKDLESFLPLQEVFSQWKGRRKRTDKPLFPGYLFVRVGRAEVHEVAVNLDIREFLKAAGSAPTVAAPT